VMPTEAESRVDKLEQTSQCIGLSTAHHSHIQSAPLCPVPVPRFLLLLRRVHLDEALPSEPVRQIHDDSPAFAVFQFVFAIHRDRNFRVHADPFDLAIDESHRAIDRILTRDNGPNASAALSTLLALLRCCQSRQAIKAFAGSPNRLQMQNGRK
jgi:hypothetical protein